MRGAKQDDKHAPDKHAHAGKDLGDKRSESRAQRSAEAPGAGTAGAAASVVTGAAASGAAAPSFAAARPASAPGFADRLRARYRRAPLAAVFIAYLAAYLLLACGLTFAGIWLVNDAYEWLWDAEMPVHVYNGPYLYDQEGGDIVPAASIEIGDYSGDRSLYLGINPADTGAEAETAGEGAAAKAGAGSSTSGGTLSGTELEETHEVYATLEMVADDPTLAISDWGGNFADPYDSDAYEEVLSQGGDNINPADLPAYDAHQRSVRTQVDGGAIGLSTDAETPSSNVAYYISQDMDLTPAVAAMRALSFLMPFMVFGVLAWVMFRRFYRLRLAEPLAVLTAATDKIAAQDLDFAVPAVSGREFGRLAEAFEHMRASLLAAQRRMWRTAEERKRLNAAFAHDLRTPLTVLKGTLEISRLRLEADAARLDALPAAAEKSAAPSGEEPSGEAARAEADGAELRACADGARERLVQASHTLATLDAQVARLQRYADLMSTASKLEDRPVVCERVELGAFARELAGEAEALVAASPKPLRFSCALAVDGAAPRLVDVGAAGGSAEAATGCRDGGVPELGGKPAAGAGPDAGSEPAAGAGVAVALDPALVAEAVGNLLNNARGHAAGEVTLALSYANGELACTVTDDGEGFTPEALRRGCEPFYSEAKSAEHFGMGLNIASVLAELHGGGLALANVPVPGHGARVTARFRCGEPSAGGGAAA